MAALYDDPVTVRAFDSVTISGTAYDTDGSAFDLTGYDLYVSVNADGGSTQSVTKNSVDDASEVSVTVAASGTYSVTLTAADTGTTLGAGRHTLQTRAVSGSTKYTVGYSVVTVLPSNFAS